MVWFRSQYPAETIWITKRRRCKTNCYRTRNFLKLSPNAPLKTLTKTKAATEKKTLRKLLGIAARDIFISILAFLIFLNS